MSSTLRLPTGVVGLDEILQGGVPDGAWILVIGPPGSGKSTLGKQFLYTAAQKRRSPILLSTADSRDVVLRSMLTFGWDREESERVEMLDCYSWRQGDEFSIDLRRLTEAGMKISDFFANYQNANLVVDSFTDFLLNNEAEVALRFLSQLKGKLQPRKITTLVILEEGPHRQEISATAEYIADGTIRTRYDETGRYLMVSRMLATPVQLGWSKFTIQKGIDVVVRNFFGGGGA